MFPMEMVHYSFAFAYFAEVTFKCVSIMGNKVYIDGIWYKLNEEKKEAWVTRE